VRGQTIRERVALRAHQGQQTPQDYLSILAQLVTLVSWHILANSVGLVRLSRYLLAYLP
jgi:hypothetical protein